MQLRTHIRTNLTSISKGSTVSIGSWIVSITTANTTKLAISGRKCILLNSLSPDRYDNFDLKCCNTLNWLISKVLPGNFLKINTIGLQWCEVNIGSNNGVVPSVIKPCGTRWHKKNGQWVILPWRINVCVDKLYDSKHFVYIFSFQMVYLWFQAFLLCMLVHVQDKITDSQLQNGKRMTDSLGSWSEYAF